MEVVLQNERAQLIHILRAANVPSLLRAFAMSENFEFHWNITYNSNCPEDVLRTLAKSKRYVRAGVVKNPNCPVDVLRTLAWDESYNVRDYVALNHNCPEDVLRTLAKDKDFYVRQTAIKKLKQWGLTN
jgi:hypothetical protein